MGKSMLIIGLGNFGAHLASKLISLGNDVMVIDLEEKTVSEFQDKYNPSNSLFGDCTSESSIKKLGVKNFDVCFVTIGENLEASLQITSHLKKYGAKHIVCKAFSDLQTNLLGAAGADEVINPEAEIANDLARSYTYDNIFDYVEVSEGFATAEIKPLKIWLGQSIIQVDIRKKYKVTIFAVKRADGVIIVPGHDYVFVKDDHLKIVGPLDAVKKFK